MLPYLFPEIYEHILTQLPVYEGCGTGLDTSTRALAQFSAANSTLRGIACLSHIWKPHYQARWSHSRSKERVSLALYGGDYRLMYIDRRRRDKRALEALERVVENRSERHALSLELVDELGADVWDVLEANREDLPARFTPSAAPSEDWFARRHWINEVCCTTYPSCSALCRCLSIRL